MNIGQRIAKFRKQKNITQEQFGEAVGVTNRTVSKWESGVSSPGIDLIPLIASSLGITLDQLFGIEKTKEDTADIAQIIKESISSSIEEYLPDILEDALSEMLPKYKSFHSKDEYSLLIIGHDKSTVCRFYGHGYVSGPHGNNNGFAIIVPAQGENVVFPGYETKEAASEALEAISKAYTARYKSIEL